MITTSCAKFEVTGIRFVTWHVSTRRLKIVIIFDSYDLPLESVRKTTLHFIIIFYGYQIGTSVLGRWVSYKKKNLYSLTPGGVRLRDINNTKMKRFRMRVTMWMERRKGEHGGNGILRGRNITFNRHDYYSENNAKKQKNTRVCESLLTLSN